MPSAPPYKNPDSPHTLPSPPRSTTDAHVALQQLSHHVPYQVLPPNGGERKRGRGRIWVGKEEGWVLNLDGRDRVMNINLFLSFSIQKRELWLCIWSSWLLLCLDYLCIITFFKIASTLSVLSSPFTQGLFLSHLVLDSVEVMASAHVSLPVTGSPWKQSGGGTVIQKVPSYW